MGSYTGQVMSSPIAAIFPGQGSQSIGMASDLIEQFPFTRKLFEEASDNLSFDLKRLIQEGTEETLQLTANSQPAILTTSYAWFNVLQEELGFLPSISAGHSLGEYSALLASGAMTLSEAVRLVRRRGELMQNAVPEGLGKMAAILGLEDDSARELCEKASSKDSIVVPANFNSPGQIVIAGNAEAVDRAIAMASEKDSPFRARKAILLKVSAPFHCPLMKPVAEIFEADLKKIVWQAMRFSVIANVDTKPHEQSKVAERLCRQIDHPVLWTGCVKAIVDSRITSFVELGPGKVLSGLVKRCAEGISATSVDSLESFMKFGGRA